MRWFLDRLRGRKKRAAQEALERLDAAADKGPDAAKRFEQATRGILGVPKEAIEGRRKSRDVDG